MSSSTAGSELPFKNDDDVVVVPPRDVSDNNDGEFVFQYAYNYSKDTPIPGPPSVDGFDEDENKYPRDSYSFLSLHGPRCKTKDDILFVSFGLLTFAAQIAFLFVMILSVISDTFRSGDLADDVDNPGNPHSEERGPFSQIFPANASLIVKATQIISLLSFFMFADETLLDIARACELFPLWWSRNSEASNCHNNHWGLFISSTLRFVQGILAVIAVFLLVMTETSVIDIVLNFTAVNFISGLDEVAFALARWGKFGPKLKREAARIERSDLPPHICSKTTHLWYCYTIVLIAAIVFGCLTGIMFYQIRPDKWITHSFRAKFQADTGFEDYSGCYHIDKAQKFNNRYIYINDAYNPNSAKVGYCLKERQWVFFRADDESSGSDPCDNLKNDNLIARSASSSSFDVSSAFQENWFSAYNTPLNMYFISGQGEDWYEENCGSFTGDGTCDAAFNNFFYDYDRGDCCASTCFGSNCGVLREISSGVEMADGREISFPNCENDRDMEPFVVEIGSVTETNESDRTWWAEKVSSIEGWEDFWRPRLVLECDGRTVLATSNIISAAGTDIETMIDREAKNCSITTEHFDLVWRASYEVQPSGMTSVEKRSRNRIPRRIGNFTQELSLDIIDLSENAFTGTIPSEIGMNTNLTVLRLDQNELTGEIPEELFQLESLTELSLSNNSLSGTIPWEIYGLENLTKLNLDHNALTGTFPTEITQLTSLTHLSLYNNRFHGEIPSIIKSLTNLKTLNLGHNLFFGAIPSEIKVFENLESLNLEHNDLEESIPVEIQSLTHLTELHLGRNRFNTTLSNDFSSLTKLTHLDLGKNSLMGAFPMWIALLTNLKHLNLGENKFVGELSSSLVESLGQLTHLNLYGNRLNGTLPFAIGELTNLEHLNLDVIGLTGTIPIEIGNLKRLTNLNLASNKIVGSIPNRIGLLNELVSLDVGQNSLSGDIPSELGSLTRLTALLMYYNNLVGTIPCQLESLTNLSVLNLNFNNLTGYVPRGLSDDNFHLATQREDQLIVSPNECSNVSDVSPERLVPREEPRDPVNWDG